MKIGINDHVHGDERVRAGAAGTIMDGARGAAYWGDQRLDRLRRRLDHPRRVLVRDFAIFELKLLLDWLKGPIIAQLALVGFVLDLVRPGGRTFGVFYKVLNLGERLDIWLSLYGPSRHAAEDPEGLMGQSREGSRTLLGQLEQIVHRIVVGENELEGELYPRATGASTPPRDPSAPAPGPDVGAPAR